MYTCTLNLKDTYTVMQQHLSDSRKAKKNCRLRWPMSPLQWRRQPDTTLTLSQLFPIADKTRK